MKAGLTPPQQALINELVEQPESRIWCAVVFGRLQGIVVEEGCPGYWILSESRKTAAQSSTITEKLEEGEIQAISRLSAEEPKILE